MLAEVRARTICEAQLPDGVRPVLQIHPHARVLIAGQALGRKVHESGVLLDAATDRDERCSMVNVDPDSAHADARVLKTIVRVRDNEAGVYGAVAPARPAV